MEWLESINKALGYIEDNLTEDICVEDVAAHVYSSGAHFQRIFNIVTGITIGEYIRNRRLSLAGRELAGSNAKVIDIAMKYRYDSSESFSKAFTRFHEITPSDAKKRGNALKYYRPLTINITISGGYTMSGRFKDDFYWNNAENGDFAALSEAEKYRSFVIWAAKARGRNPEVFDAMTEWMLDDSEWTDEKLDDNKQIFMQGVVGRFKNQNERLMRELSELKLSEQVNAAVFGALESFNAELSGNTQDEELARAVSAVFADFTKMKERPVRELIAGSKTGKFGTDSAEIFGYVNRLKECDAAVQWALFMPDLVKNQQKGFCVESFEYKTLSAMRFIGREIPIHDTSDMSRELEIMNTLEAMTEYKSGFDHDALLVHHNGLGVDVGAVHCMWGRFMKAETPVPDGLAYIDFAEKSDRKAGPPFVSCFAYAVFSGEEDAMHSTEGFDCDAMYDVTRNIILSNGVRIPYPDKYWTAEVYPDGCDNASTAYMFSTEL